MKHSTALSALVLASLSAVSARAQQAPPPPAPAVPAAPAPQVPSGQGAPVAPSGPRSTAPVQAGSAAVPVTVPEGTAAPAPPPPSEPRGAGLSPAAPGQNLPGNGGSTAAVAGGSAQAATTQPTSGSAKSSSASAASKDAPPKTEVPLLGLGIGTPDTGALPGRFRPSFGVAPRSSSDFKFDFHGFINVPLRMGLNERTTTLPTQYKSVFHGPPLVPDELDRFEHTGVTPQPWVQLGFSYGNSRAMATVIIAARSVSNASGFFNPPTQLGINDAFVTFRPDFGRRVDVQLDVGGFANRYGAMGDYDLGRYDTPVIARVGGVGETARIRIPLPASFTFLAEHGLMGQFDRAPLGVEPAGWNTFADANVGTSFAHHAHLGLALARRGQVGLHYVNAFTRDDRTAPSQADGSITVLGADATAELAPFGRFYVGGAYTKAQDARSVSGVVRVLNTFGGPGLMREYLGPNSHGTGSLTTVGAQFDISIGEVVRRPQPYAGYAPDLFFTAFSLYTHVNSDDTNYDGVDKLKYGAEVTYSALRWLAVSTRYDRVLANLDDTSRTFAVVSPRLILRTDYNSQDQVTLQYSRWMYGSGVAVRTGYAPREDPSVMPDENTFSLTASMWF